MQDLEGLDMETDETVLGEQYSCANDLLKETGSAEEKDKQSCGMTSANNSVDKVVLRRLIRAWLKGHDRWRGSRWR